MSRTLPALLLPGLLSMAIPAIAEVPPLATGIVVAPPDPLGDIAARQRAEEARCQRDGGDAIVVCGRRDGEAGRRLPLPIERDPGEVGPRIGEAPTGSDALSAERCIRLCQSQVGVNLDMVIKFAEGIGRLLEGDD